jgi:hypothetical protein
MKKIDFRNLVLEFCLVALHKAPDCYDSTQLSPSLQIARVEDRLDRLFLRILYETARVYDQDIGPSDIRRYPGAMADQRSQNPFRIDRVLVATQCYECDVGTIRSTHGFELILDNCDVPHDIRPHRIRNEREDR